MQRHSEMHSVQERVQYHHSASFLSYNLRNSHSSNTKIGNNHDEETQQKAEDNTKTKKLSDSDYVCESCGTPLSTLHNMV